MAGISGHEISSDAGVAFGMSLQRFARPSRWHCHVFFDKSEKVSSCRQDRALL